MANTYSSPLHHAPSAPALPALRQATTGSGSLGTTPNPTLSAQPTAAAPVLLQPPPGAVGQCPDTAASPKALAPCGPSSTTPPPAGCWLLGEGGLREAGEDPLYRIGRSHSTLGQSPDASSWLATNRQNSQQPLLGTAPLTATAPSVAAGAAPDMQVEVARSHSQVTVLFADIKAFTSMCNQVPPSTVSRELAWWEGDLGRRLLGS